MDQSKKIIEKLREQNISITAHTTTSKSVDETVAELGIRYDQGLSTLIFRVNGGEELVAVLRRDDTNINNKALKKEVGSSRVSFADESDLARLDIQPGLASPFILADLLREGRLHRILVDTAVKEMNTVICGSTSPNIAIEIQKDDLFSQFESFEVVSLSEPNVNRQNTHASNTKRILTGDRPTGKLHIGHYVGSLRDRVRLQHEYETFILIANIHALGDNRDNPEKIRASITELLCDYYAVGIDFETTTVYLQSEVPAVHEIFMYLANFTSLQQLMHNPTLKTEIKQNKMEESTPLAFFVYPIHQAADILCVNADLVPVGKDQAPMIEDTRELARKFNNAYGESVLHEPRALYGAEKNLPGTDGNAKMGKSLHNFISLSETEEDLRKKVFSVYTDPNRIHATDPGQIEGNVAFAYHDAFNSNKDEVTDLKERYKQGKVGDVEVKEKLFVAMNNLLTPIRERRKEAEQKKELLLERALDGSKKVQNIAQDIAAQMKDAMGIGFGN